MLPYLSAFFFFQAEDGIRDGHVTGVQTCALPISQEVLKLQSSLGYIDSKLLCNFNTSWVWLFSYMPIAGASRSEERRVGNECRRRWWGDYGMTRGINTGDFRLEVERVRSREAGT